MVVDLLDLDRHGGEVRIRVEVLGDHVGASARRQGEVAGREQDERHLRVVA